MTFTDEEIRVLKEFAQQRLHFEEIFSKDEDGNKIPEGNYSDWVKAMKGQ